ncbi:hypothetical protein [Polaromonas sp. UC242_47]|uniref:hypothetical protein n=1 Tax=Polaromonas sp. UC242_47 TaxID=3374626 RepID=UPI0037ABCBFA
MTRRTHPLWIALGLALMANFCAAATSTGSFSVGITLTQAGSVTPRTGGGSGASTIASGVCISETLNERTNALVRVVCGTGQFVSITPFPGKPFLGTHGGAFRYDLGVGNASPATANSASPLLGAGTVTALRIYNANGSDGPLEMLVSF